MAFGDYVRKDEDYLKEGGIFDYLNELNDMTHLGNEDAYTNMVTNYLIKHGFDSEHLKNRQALLDEKYKENFRDVLFSGNRFHGIELIGHKVKREKRLGKLRLAISLVMESLYSRCPIRTGFGITHGIRWHQTRSGAEITIGGGIADYLVHLAYPFRGSTEANVSKQRYRGGNSGAIGQHRAWIDKALLDIRSQVKDLGYKVMRAKVAKGYIRINISAE